jgi:hypothetical protein
MNFFPDRPKEIQWKTEQWVNSRQTFKSCDFNGSKQLLNEIAPL